MAVHNCDDISFESFRIFGMDALITDNRINRLSVPDGYYAYDLRHDDDNWNEPVTIEDHVIVNHAYTVLTRNPINLGPDGYLILQKKDWSFTQVSDFGPSFAYEPKNDSWEFHKKRSSYTQIVNA